MTTTVLKVLTTIQRFSKYRYSCYRTSTTKCSSGSPHRERRRRDEEASSSSGFSAALHRTPPPPPPALLRRLGVKETTGVGKVSELYKQLGHYIGVHCILAVKQCFFDRLIDWKKVFPSMPIEGQLFGSIWKV